MPASRDQEHAVDARRGRELVDRLFECRRPSPEWDQALADLRVWSMAAWNEQRTEPVGERSIAERLEDAERAAIYGVARVAGSFASDLAEAREAARVLSAAIERHVAAHGDPSGELGGALEAAANGLARLRSQPPSDRVSAVRTVWVDAERVVVREAAAPSKPAEAAPDA